MSRRILTRVALSIILVSMVVLAACSNASASQAPANPNTPAAPANTGNSSPPAAPVNAPKAPTGRVKATWITPIIEGDAVTFSAGDVEKDTIIHFSIDSGTGTGKMPFMAYTFEGKTYVRADICPPCRSYNFSIEKNILICDTCGTRFEAKNGEGVSGACVNYPKAAVSWTTAGGNIVVKSADLRTAYQDTLKPGLP